MIAMGKVSRQSSNRSLRHGALLSWLATDVIRMVFDLQHDAYRPPERLELSASNLIAFLLTTASPSPSSSTAATDPKGIENQKLLTTSTTSPEVIEQLQRLIDEHNILIDQLCQSEKDSSESPDPMQASSIHSLLIRATQLLDRAEQMLHRSSPLTWNLLIALCNATALDAQQRLSFAEEAIEIAVALNGVESNTYTTSVLKLSRLAFGLVHQHNTLAISRSASMGDVGLAERSNSITTSNDNKSSVMPHESVDTKSIHWDGRGSRSSSKDDTDDPSSSSSHSTSSSASSSSSSPTSSVQSSSTSESPSSSIRAVPLLLRQACLNQAERFADTEIDYALQCAHAASRLSRACIGDESEECGLDLIRNSSLLRRNQRYADALLHCLAIEPLIDARNPCCSELYGEMSQIHWQLKQIEHAHRNKRKQVRVLLQQKNAARLPTELENAGVYFERSSVAASPYKLQDLAEAVRFYLAAALVTRVEGQRAQLLKKVTKLIFANRPMREADIGEYLNKLLHHRSLEFFISRRLSQAQMIRLVYVPPIAEQAYDECQVYPAFQGFLTKKGHVVHNWKHRWFVLHRRELSYYRSQKDSDRRGCIDVATISAVQEFPPTIAKEHLQYAFTIQTPGKPFVCCAPSAADRKLWIDILHRAMQFWQDWMQEDDLFSGQKDGGGLF